ncbi:MAG: preprotein translocase subunit YajC [Dehalococcoidia bacterium]
MNGAEISFLVIIGVLVAFYLMIIRPGQQEQKRQQQTIRDLKVGDEVITTAGFFARVKEIHTPEEGPVELLLELEKGVQLRALTSAITRLVSKAEEPAEQREQTEEI